MSSLPRNTKMDPKQSYSCPGLQLQQGTKRHLSFSTSSSASSNPSELLQSSAFKNLLQHNTGIYSHHSPRATARTDGTCSAYSSPRVPKRDTVRSKDTLDLHSPALTQKALRDLQLRRNTNKNWTFGKYRTRNVDNADAREALCGRGRLLSKSANGNEASGAIRSFQKEMRSVSNQGISEASSARAKSKYQMFNMPRRASEPDAANMVAVAPFRFRFQEEPDAATDDVSDCSSDSMEVCCEDLGLHIWSS